MVPACSEIFLSEKRAPAAYKEKDAARVFARERVPLRVDLGTGTARAFVLSSDLGHDYVSLNADYRS